MAHAAQTGISRAPRRLQKALRALGMPLLVAIFVLLLPILIPAAALDQAIRVRRLARARCESCGTPFGLAEVRRAQREAQAKGATIVGAAIAGLRRPRVVVPWTVTCPACGHGHRVRPGTFRLAPARGEIGSNGRTA